MRNILWFLSLIVACVAMATPAFATEAEWTFDDVPPGVQTPFLYTNNGVQAAFLSSGDPGGFYVSPTIFHTLTGNVLLTARSQSLNLGVGFSQPAFDLYFRFATDAPLDVPIQVVFYYNNVEMAAIGEYPQYSYQYSEGTFFADPGVIFNSIVIGSNAPNIAIDDLIINQIPEPSSLLLLGGALPVALGAIRRFVP